VSKVVIAVPAIPLALKRHGQLRLKELVRREIRIGELGANFSGTLQAITFLVGDGTTVFASAYKVAKLLKL
jgi:hypothetical protein